MPARFDQFIYNLGEISLYWHRIASAEMKIYGLKGSSAVYFTRLAARPEGITAAELAALCGRDKADVSREIARFEKAGLVSRASTGSGYRAPIILTEEGKTLAREVTRKAKQAQEFAGSTLTQQERAIFYSAFHKITENLRILSEQGLSADPGSEE